MAEMEEMSACRRRLVERHQDRVENEWQAACTNGRVRFGGLRANSPPSSRGSGRRWLEPGRFTNGRGRPVTLE
jgi:hypothetical protein